MHSLNTQTQILPIMQYGVSIELLSFNYLMPNTNINIINIYSKYNNFHLLDQPLIVERYIRNETQRKYKPKYQGRTTSSFHVKGIYKKKKKKSFIYSTVSSPIIYNESLCY